MLSVSLNFGTDDRRSDRHEALARDAGVSDVTVAEDGELVELGPDGPLRKVGKAPTGRIATYGGEELPEEVLRERLLAAPECRLIVFPRQWEAADFEGMAVAVADMGDEQEAERFAKAARQAGVPCNVIDRPAFCTFQFGSIVNRSPLVVGISTSGAAPILGQAVRRRIETLLPSFLSDWARLAERMRPTVLGLLRPGGERRGFWEAFVDRAFSSRPSAESRHETADLIRKAAGAPSRTGHVTFVGAGPGEAELLTIKAVRALQAADVILFDDLVSDEVLELARREAKRILVGKRAGRPSCRSNSQPSSN